MIRRVLALGMLALVTIEPAVAACHWGWYCDDAGNCGYVPYCDSPTDVPPPFQGTNPGPPGGPLDPSAPPRRPLPGFKPIPAGRSGVRTQEPPPAKPASEAPRTNRGGCSN